MATYSSILAWGISWTEDPGRLQSLGLRWRQRMQWLDSVTNSMDVNMSKLWETGEDRGWATVRGVAKSRTQLSDRTTAPTTLPYSK